MSIGGWMISLFVVVLAIVGVVLAIRGVLGRRKRKRLQHTPVREVRAAGGDAGSDPAGRAPPSTPATRGVGRIFVAYRRSDSRHITGRIYDRLAEHYGAERVLRDVDSFPLGVDFREYAARSIASCSVALVVIGARFLERGPDGIRRIDQDADHLRVELRSILDAGVPLVPVLVDGVTVPGTGDLPEDIAAMSYRTGLDVREDPFFNDDVHRLIAGVDRIVP